MQQNPETASRSYDHFILVSALTLLALGLTMVFNASTVMAQAQYQDPYFFIKRQALYALLGLGVLFLGRAVDYHRYQRLAYPFLFISLICLILVFAMALVPTTVKAGG